jgi:hypothetical protein
MEKLAEGLLWYVAFLFSTTLHEASHAFAAFINILFFGEAQYN